MTCLFQTRYDTIPMVATNTQDTTALAGKLIVGIGIKTYVCECEAQTKGT